MGDIIDNDMMNFPKPEKNAGSHESDDFEKVDQEHAEEDDFLTTSGNNADFTLHNLNSTDRPLVTFGEEMTAPSAPPAPPSLSTVPESLKFDDDDEDDDSEQPEYEFQYSQPPQPKKESKKEVLEPQVDFTAPDLSSFDTLKSHDFSLENLDPYDPPKSKTPEIEKDDFIQITPDPPKVEPVFELMPVKSTPVISQEKEEENEVESPKKSKCSCPFSAWFNPQNLDPRVVDLVYWRDPKKSGIVFAGILIILLSLSYFSLISVLAYLTLAVLAGTLSFRIYKNVLAAVQKSNEGHPFKQYLEQDLVISSDQIQEITQSVVVHTNAVAHELRRLILVEDLVDSIKFGVMLWCLTYVGAWFNGMTLLILGFVAAFTLPKVYETNKTQIDHYINIARTQVDDIMSKIKAKVPIGKKAKEQ